MPPGKPRAQREHGVGIDRQQAVEAGTQFAAGVGAGATVVREREAAAVDVGLAVARRAEILRLHRGVRREPAEHRGEAIAAKASVGSAGDVVSASAPASRRDSRKNRAGSYCRASRPRRISPAAGTGGTWSPPNPPAAPREPRG